MGLIEVWPSPSCNGSGSAHYFVEVVHNVFACKYCFLPFYQPYIFADAKSFADEIRKTGRDRAYGKRVKKSPRIKNALNILMAAHLSRQVLTRKQIATAFKMVRENYGQPVPVGEYEVSSGRWK